MRLPALLKFTDFKPIIADRAFPLEERLLIHHTLNLIVVSIGDVIQKQHLRRTGRHWVLEGEVQANEPAVLLLTPRSVVCDVRELPALPGGNTESNLARAVLERPETFLRDLYEPDRRYHLVPFSAPRTALICSIKESDVRRGESEVTRSGWKLVQAWCGLAQAVRFALADYPQRFPTANVLLVCDQAFCLEVGLNSAGRPESANLTSISREETDPFAGIVGELADHLSPDPAQAAQAVLYRTPFSILTGQNLPPPAGVQLITQNISTSDLLCLG
ncbi:MAG: hypothetical protein PHE83_18470 [Opitutaceae bacterium]|nr:hypothetical protein [Opitutaceae bacterium]